MSNLLKVDKPARAKPALKLVKTLDLDRDQWLSVRKGGIGSSDAGAAVGLNPYKSPLELWLEKTGRDANLPKTDPNDETSPMYWGTLLEPIVAAHYTRRMGEIDPDTAQVVINCISAFAGLRQVDELDERLRALEGKAA